MALVTEQQETMFAEAEEAQASVHEELKHEHAEEAHEPTEFSPSEFSTEPEAVTAHVEAAAAEVVPEATHEDAPFAESAAVAAEPAATEHAAQAPESTHAESLPVLTAADFSALEERVLRAVSLVRREREGRIAAEERVAQLEGRIVGLEQETGDAAKLREEIEALRAEREQVRLRVERLLGQLDSLEF